MRWLIKHLCRLDRLVILPCSESLWLWGTPSDSKTLPPVQSSNDYDAVKVTLLVDRKDWPEFQRRVFCHRKS